MARESGGVVWIDIDGERLKEIIKGKGTNPSSVARKLGCGHDITNAIRRGKMKKPLALLMCSYLSIETTDFIADEPIAKEEPQEIIIAPQISEEQWERLDRTIYEAVSRALKAE